MAGLQESLTSVRAMSTPTLRKCPECGEEKPRKAFWGKNREPQLICTPCRRKIKRHARYIKAKDKQRQQEAKTALRTALRAQARMKEESLVAAAVVELDRMISRIKNRIRSHNKRIEEGTDTPRTFTGLKHQTQKLDYYLDIRRWVMDDAGRGIVLPLEHYLSDTTMLHRHGYPVAVTRDQTRENDDD